MIPATSSFHVADGLEAAPLLASFLERSTAVAVLRVDLEGRVLSVNRALADRLGRAPSQITGTPLESYLAGGESDSLQRRLAQPLPPRRPEERTLVHFRDAAGAPFTLSCQLDVHPQGLLLIGERPEQDRAVNEELMRINNELAVLSREHARQGRELQRANADLEQFAFNASHDLQEPLRTVTGHLGLLARHLGEALDERGRRHLAYAVDGAERMKRLIADLLSLARTQSAELALATVELEDVLRAVTQDLERVLDESGGAVAWESLPTVRGDAGLLARLLQNLVGNALKFHGSKPPRIAIDATRRGDEWEVTVADDGIGFEPRHAEEVFQPFRRLHGRERYPGTGIGLAICRRIVERHGGRIWVESAPGVGSTFHFTLPAAAPSRAGEGGEPS